MQKIREMVERYPALQPCVPQMQQAVTHLMGCFSAGGKLLVCGNGGSCADAQHIVGELMKGFLLARALPKECKDTLRRQYPQIPATLLQALQQALPALALAGEGPLATAFCNDVDPAAVFAQQVYGYGRPGDVLLGISTSGNAENVYQAALTAKACGMVVLGLTGAGGGRLGSVADVCICVPQTETFAVQELHLPVYHAVCAQLENHFFGGADCG